MPKKKAEVKPGSGIVPAAPGKKSKTLANSIAKLVAESGLPPEKALAKIGVNPAIIRNTPNIREHIKQALAETHIPAAIAREYVRSARVKLLATGMQNIERVDPETGEVVVDYDATDLALKAANQIASDPEVGLQQAPLQTIQLDLGPLKDILRKVTLEGFDAPVIDLEPLENPLDKSDGK